MTELSRIHLSDLLVVQLDGFLSQFLCCLLLRRVQLTVTRRRHGCLRSTESKHGDIPAPYETLKISNESLMTAQMFE